MPSLNRVTLIGHAGSDPELKHTPSNKTVCNFSVATNEQWKDADGNKKEHTEWHRVTVWGKLAENTSRYVKKGGLVLIEGKIQSRRYQAGGQDKIAVEIIAEKVLFLGGKNGNDRQANGGSNSKDVGESSDDLPF